MIHRTAALLATELGASAGPFRYREGIEMPGLVAAGAVALSLAGIRSAARARPALRRAGAAALETLFRPLGHGPRDDQLDGWSWQMKVRARTTSGQAVWVFVAGDGHPGYLTTARMFGEAGLALAEPGATPDRAGCLTPAAALGGDCAARFGHAGSRFPRGLRSA